MVRHFAATALFLIFAISAACQELVAVNGEYTYYAPGSVAPDQAVRTAIERAKIQALADAFGTTVTQTNSIVTKSGDGAATTDFLSIGGSEVKGEWIETTHEQCERSLVDGQDVYIATVSGIARKITSAAIDYRVRILRNSTDDRNESSEFRSGDELYVSFVSPAAGYLALYLVDADDNAVCLLPYRNQSDGVYGIDANRRYLFFSQDEAAIDEQPYVDEYQLTCSGSAENNVVYAVFSTERFTKAATDAGELQVTTFADFQKWLANCRKVDARMHVSQVPISIVK